MQAAIKPSNSDFQKPNLERVTNAVGMLFLAICLIGYGPNIYRFWNDVIHIGDKTSGGMFVAGRILYLLNRDTWARLNLIQHAKANQNSLSHSICLGVFDNRDFWTPWPFQPYDAPALRCAGAVGAEPRVTPRLLPAQPNPGTHNHQQRKNNHASSNSAVIF